MNMIKKLKAWFTRFFLWDQVQDSIDLRRKGIDARRLILEAKNALRCGDMVAFRRLEHQIDVAKLEFDELADEYERKWLLRVK